MTQTSLNSEKEMVFERFMGGEVGSFVVLLNERFWGCLKSHAAISLLK